MEVYHISERKYPSHYTLKAETFDGDSFFYQTLSEDNKRINDFLSSLRPEGEPSRRKCIFAFARKEYCVLFGKDLIQAGKEMHLYRCVMKCPEGHPMILLNQFQKVDETKWPRICDEYWYPIRHWKVLEFLSDEMEVVEEIPIPEVSSLRGYNDYVEDTATALNLIRKRPPKFRLVISDACTGVQMGDIGIDEMIEEEAKAKSYKVLCEAAVAFSDGEYVGKLFRWMPDSGLWQDVSAPVISCSVASSDVILTVPRIRYNKECRLLNELHEASNTLGIIQQQAAPDGSSQMLGPSSIEDRFRVIKQALKTLYVEYRPEYLDAHSLAGLISRINRAFELIQSCSLSVVEYTQVSTAQVGVVQMLISDLLFAASR